MFWGKHPTSSGFKPRRPMAQERLKRSTRSHKSTTRWQVESAPSGWSFPSPSELGMGEEEQGLRPS